ncbi:MAG: NAD-dependent epimerase/dehydratase family protein [Prolixibacteraceae bacterium]
MQTILGSGGAIGTHLATELYKFTTNIRLVSRHPKAVNSTDQLMAIDLTSRNHIFKAVEGSEIVYVTIGFPYRTKIWEKLWPSFIHNVINACKFYKARLVFFDNMYMYGDKYMSRMTEETPIEPCCKKGKVRAKVAEKVTREFEKAEIDVLIARAPDFLALHNGVLAQTIYANLKKGKKAICLASDSHKRNVILPSIAAKATALLGNTPDAYNQVWHLPSSHEALTGKEWTELFASELNCKPKHQTISPFMISILGLFAPVMKEFKEMMYQYTQDYFFDSSKFENRFQFKHVSVTEAVKIMITEDQLPK